MGAYEQRSYAGAAPDTVLNGSVNSAVLAFSVAAGTGTGYPDGSEGPFFVVIDYDNASTEKVHCTARTGDTFTMDVRGADGTTALVHADQAKVRHCFTATDGQEANRTAHQTLGAVTAKGDVLSGSAANTLVKTAVGADGLPLVADSSNTGGIGFSANLVGVSLDATSEIDGVTAAAVATVVNADIGTVVSGLLGSSFLIPNTGGVQTFLTTGSLAPGKWDVCVDATLQGAVSGGALIEANVNTGTATISGPTIKGCGPFTTAGEPVGVSLRCIVVVTVAATIKFGAIANVGGIDVMAGFTLPSGGATVANSTGYTAVKVA